MLTAKTYHGIQVVRVKDGVRVFCHPLLPGALEILSFLLL